MPYETILSRGPRQHFFGYYGISPWDPSGPRHLALETDFHDRRPTRGDCARVGLLTAATGEFEPYAITSAFNFQQGAMLHWITAGPVPEFTFNDWAGDRLVARAISPANGARRTLGGAIAAVAPTAPHAIALNYARMFHCRPVVGYANDLYPRECLVPQPRDDGLWHLDLATGACRLLLSIGDLLARHPCALAPGALAWFNHVCFSPDGARLMFFCRLRHGGRRLDSLWLLEADGTNLREIIPFGRKVSHYVWLDARRLLVSTDVLGPMRFVTWDLASGRFAPFGGNALPADGHPALSPDGQWLVCDTYPRGPERRAELLLYRLADGQCASVGGWVHPEPFSGDIRCDLHPRWRPDSRAVTFDSVASGSRQIHEVLFSFAELGEGKGT